MQTKRLLPFFLIVFLVFTLFPLRVRAAGIIRVQGAKRGSTITNSISITLDSTPIQGNVLVAVFHSSDNSEFPRISSFTQTNVTWTLQVYTENNNVYGSGQVGEIWVGIVGASPSANIVIAISPYAQYGAIVNVCEYSGLLTTGFLDKTATDNPDTDDLSGVTGTTNTTTQANELWVGGVASLQNPPRTQSDPTNGFTMLDGTTITQYQVSSYLEKIVSATGTAASGTTFSGSATHWGMIITLKASGGQDLTFGLAENLSPSSTSFFGKELGFLESNTVQLGDVVSMSKAISGILVDFLSTNTLYPSATLLFNKELAFWKYDNLFTSATSTMTKAVQLTLFELFEFVKLYASNVMLPGWTALTIEIAVAIGVLALVLAICGISLVVLRRRRD